MVRNSAILRSAFAYDSEVSEEVWGLFSSMADEPEKSVPYVDEIINAGIKGKIDFGRYFNLDGYCYTVEENLKMKAGQRAKKESFIFDGDLTDDGGEAYTKKGGVNSNRFEALEDGFNKLEDDDELLSAIRSIKNVREDFLLDEGVDLVKLLKSATEFLPQAITDLKKLCEDFELLGEQIQVVLKSGVPIQKCFGVDI